MSKLEGVSLPKQFLKWLQQQLHCWGFQASQCDTEDTCAMPEEEEQELCPAAMFCS